MTLLIMFNRYRPPPFNDSIVIMRLADTIQISDLETMFYPSNKTVTLPLQLLISGLFYPRNVSLPSDHFFVALQP